MVRPLFKLGQSFFRVHTLQITVLTHYLEEQAVLFRRQSPISYSILPGIVFVFCFIERLKKYDSVLSFLLLSGLNKHCPSYSHFGGDFDSWKQSQTMSNVVRIVKQNVTKVTTLRLDSWTLDIKKGKINRSWRKTETATLILVAKIDFSLIIS